MPTLSQLFPLHHLALLRRVPFWAQALALCALFAIAGVAALDDYGVGGDAHGQRRIANANANYIATGDISRLLEDDDAAYRYHGMGFEMPLILAERALGLQDSRHIYLTRHLLTHLFFIAGGFACGMLAYRTLGSRWVALMAMLMFLLHPRLYAHSFFNTKDIPFAAMLLIALYVAHLAFRKDTIGAFLLCGIGVGFAIESRLFGLMLLPMILAMRALDLWQASGRAERKHILASAGIFTAATFAIVYIIHPYYWENPLRFIEGLLFHFQRSIAAENLFMGEIYPSDAVPWNYIPVWFAITAPPVALALGALGAAAVCWQAITRPLAALRDRETRFRALPLGCILLPVAVVIILKPSIYEGWRHMYFIWGPFCLLAAVWLHIITNIHMEGIFGKFGARLQGQVGGGRLMRALAYGIAGFGLLTTLAAMAVLHPYEYVYFNALTDTETPGALANRYDMDYWQISHPQLLEYLLERYPDDTPRVWLDYNTPLRLMHPSDRGRIVNVSTLDADFYLNVRPYYRRDTPEPPRFHSIRAYGNDISFILAPNSDAYRDYYRAEYNDVEANGKLLARAVFDIYVHNGALHYLSANCAPLLAGRVSLHIIPNDPADLPADSRERGFENLDFRISGHADFFTHIAFFDGNCIIRRPLPDYPIARIRTGQSAATRDGAEWSVDVNMVARAAAQAVYDSIAAGDYGRPVARSGFDVYLRGDVLAYLKEPCAAGDADARFFLHIIPDDPADLPAIWREYGFDNLDFQFGDHGGRAGDKCVATLELPGYAIERIRTGQFVSGDGQLWGVEFTAAR